MKVEPIRKTGIITKGLVYGLIGILAFLAAFDMGGETTGKNGVIKFLQEQTFGTILLVILSAGLIGYAFWRLYSAFLDGKNEGSDKTGTIKRIGYFFSGLIYGSLGVSIISSVFSSGGNSGAGGSGASKEDIAATILNWEYGQMVLYLVALIILGVAVYQAYKGITGKFMEDIEQHGSISSEEALKKAGKTGYIARGFAFLVIAWFTFKAASQHNSDSIRGMEGVFNYLHSMPLGQFLMALMAIGLIAYGVFQYYLARYSSAGDQVNSKNANYAAT